MKTAEGRQLLAQNLRTWQQFWSMLIGTEYLKLYRVLGRIQNRLKARKGVLLVLFRDWPTSRLLRATYSFGKCECWYWIVDTQRNNSLTGCRIRLKVTASGFTPKDRQPSLLRQQATCRFTFYRTSRTQLIFRGRDEYSLLPRTHFPFVLCWKSSKNCFPV